MTTLTVVHDVFPPLEMTELKAMSWEQVYPVQLSDGTQISTATNCEFIPSGQLQSFIISAYEDVMILLGIVEEAILEFIGPYSVVTGRSYDFRIHHYCIGEDPTPRLLMPWDVTEPFDAARFDVIRQCSNHQLTRAYRHLRRAILSDRDTELHCYMALEALRQAFSDSADKNSGRSWDQMRDALGIDRAWIKTFQTFAERFRHGDANYAVTNHAERNRPETLRGTRRAIEQFARFLTARNARAATPPKA